MKIQVKGNCPACNKEWVVEVEEQDWLNYTENGKLAQYAFSYLQPSERELLISGICQECWDAVFGNEQEDEDDWDLEESDDFDSIEDEELT